MNKIFITLIVIIILLVGWFLLRTSPTSEPVEPDTSVMSHIIGTEINVPGTEERTRIQSAGGQIDSLPQGTFTIGEEGRGTVTMLVDSMGSITTTEGIDVFIPFTVTEGDSGTRVYLGYFFFDGRGLAHRDSLFIGDRVAVVGLEINQGEGESHVAVNYLDYDINQGYNELPEVEKQIEAVVRDRKLMPLLL